MSEVAFSPNTYAGEEYAELIMPSLVPVNGIVDKGLVTLMTGVKKRKVLRPVDINVEFQNPSCNFNDQDDDMTIGEKYIDPVKYEVMIEMCYEDLKDSWDAARLKAGSLNDYQPPQNIEDALLWIVGRKIAIMNEQMYINGKSGVTAGTVSFSAAYPGLIARLIAGSDVNKVAIGNISGASMALTGITSANPGVVTVASTASLKTGDKVTIVGANGAQTVGGTTINGQTFTITVLSATTFSLNATTTGTAATSGTVVAVNAASILAVFSYILMAVSSDVLSNPDTKIWISEQAALSYAFAQATVATGSGGYFVGKKEMDFLGEKLEVVKYLPANTVIVAPSSNIFLGVDETGDETYIRITDMSKATGDDVYRYKASMKTDINYVKGGDIYLFAPVVA